MLHDSTPPRSRRAGITLIAVVAAASVLPFQFTARTIQEPAAAAQAAAAPAPAQREPAAVAAVPVQRPVTKVPQVAPATKATPAHEEELRKAVAEQRGQMREIERALVTMRRQFEELLERTEAMRSASNADQRALREQQAVAEQQRANPAPGQREPQTPAAESRTPQDEMRRLVEQRQALGRTQQLLEERLRSLIIEQDAVDRRLRELGDEINGVRQQPGRAR